MSHVLARLHVRLQDLIDDEQGQDLIEYALAGSCIFLIVAVTFPPIAVTLNSWFQAVANGLA